MELVELKEWMRIDGDDENSTLIALLKSSELIIKQSTGVASEDVQSDLNAQALYNLVQKLIITDFYENRDGTNKINPIMISMYAQLEAYKLGDKV